MSKKGQKVVSDVLKSDQKGCPKSDPKRSLLRVILDLHFDPLLVVHAGYAWDSASSITVPVQEVSKR